MDEDLTQGPPSKPLFPIKIVSQESSSQKTESYHIEEYQLENDLETLKLNIKPSTLNAIIAVQNNDLQQYGHDKSLTEAKKRKSSTSDINSVAEDIPVKRKTKSKDKKKKHKKTKYVSDIAEPPKKHKTVIKIPAGAIFLEDIPGLEPQHAFHIDRKANSDLWHYKSVSKNHIAKYKCFIHSCLGGSNILNKETKAAKKPKHSWRYWGKKSYKKSLLKGLNFISSGKHLKPENYIPFPKDAISEETKAPLGSYSCLDYATTQYIQGVGTAYSKPQEDDIEMCEIFEKVRSYNEKTRESPHNIKLWLDFVQFQDIVAQKDKSMPINFIHSHDINRPSKSVIEKKLSVLEKAIEFNPSSLELKLVRLELLQDVWETEKCEKAWQDLLFSYAADVDLWRQYLSNQQSRLVKFSFGRILKLYHKCFQTVVPILEGQVKVVSKPENMEDKLLGLFFQYCDFLHHTGYTERAISSFQGMIELNLFSPTSLNLSSFSQRVEAFKTFWESGEPRFGEPNAKGWSHWMDKKQKGNNVYIPDRVDTDELEDKILLEKLPRSLTWLKMEKIRQEAHLLPWKPDSTQGEREENCEDSDRIVMFDDIKPAMFRLIKSESCLRAICLLLKFLGLSCDNLDKMLSNVDISYHGTKFDQFSIIGLSQISTLARFKCDLNVDSRWMPSKGVVKFLRDILIQSESYFSTTNRNIFTLFRLDLEVLKSGVTKVTEMTKSEIKEIKKMGKNLLKDYHNRSNLIIWNSYVRLLWACSDNINETVSMIDIAMGIFTGSTAFSEVEKALGLSLLCKTYCEIILNLEPLEHISMTTKNVPPSKEDKHQVIACLGALVENKPFKSGQRTSLTPASVLKIRRRFETLLRELCDKINTNSSIIDSDLFITLTECFALFELSASDFEAANETFLEAIKEMKEKCLKGNVVQHLYTRHISFITNVKGVLVIPLSVTRQVLDQALLDYPQCPYYHAVLLQLESGAQIAGRLRKFYEKNLRTSTSLMTALFYVMSELMRHQAVMKSLFVTDQLQTNISDCGSVNRLRAIFEKCVQMPNTSHCPLLWRLYILFEAKYGHGNRAKGLFYRALQNCPWAKCIYMDGVSLFGDNEMQEIMDLLTEEEIRVRIPLEEVDLLLNAAQEEGEKFDEVNNV